MKRVVLWFGSLLLSVTLFSLLFGGMGGIAVFGLTLMFALPVACLNLPVVLALKDAEGWRVWAILFSGILIGPVFIALWTLILQLRNHDPNVWLDEPFGGRSFVLFALIVGSLTTFLYVISLKVLHRRSGEQGME
jgi:hypothetical protein